MILMDGVWVPDVPLEVYLFLLFHFLTVFFYSKFEWVKHLEKA